MDKPRFLITMRAAAGSRLFDDPHRMEVFRRNLSFVVSKFNLTLSDATFTSEEFSGTVEAEDLRAVAKAADRLHRFSAKEMQMECDDSNTTAARQLQSPVSIWSSPPSCRRV